MAKKIERILPPMLREKSGLIQNEEMVERIETASRGSLFDKYREKREQQVKVKIEKLLEEKQSITSTQLKSAGKFVNSVVEKVKSNAIKSIQSRRVIVHIDMDAFYAAVETLENKIYENVPMAVGGYNMLCTSNYVARRFGVRSAMPGFIAKKLCPELVIIQPDMEKYAKYSEQVMSIIKDYSEDITRYGLDEASFNLTDHQDLQNISDSSSWYHKIHVTVQNLRDRIHRETGLTCSAGVSYSYTLAKICSSRNKPNGQFVLIDWDEDLKNILSFLHDTRIDRIPGIGTVTAAMLGGININSCCDIIQNAPDIYILFGQLKLEWLISTSYGLDCDDGSVKYSKGPTVGTERTFTPSNDANVLRSILHEICEEVASTLIESNRKARNIVLKVKLNTFDSFTRSVTLNKYVQDSNILYTHMVGILDREFEKITEKNQKVRLLGVRVGEMVTVPAVSTQSDICDSSPEVPVKRRKKSHTSFQRCSLLNFFDSSSNSSSEISSKVPLIDAFTCPCCGKLFRTISRNDEKLVNEHIDSCLSMQYIKDNLDLFS